MKMKPQVDRLAQISARTRQNVEMLIAQHGDGSTVTPSGSDAAAVPPLRPTPAAGSHDAGTACVPNGCWAAPRSNRVCLLKRMRCITTPTVVSRCHKTGVVIWAALAALWPGGLVPMPRRSSRPDVAVADGSAGVVTVSATSRWHVYPSTQAAVADGEERAFLLRCLVLGVGDHAAITRRLTEYLCRPSPRRVLRGRSTGVVLVCRRVRL